MGAAVSRFIFVLAAWPQDNVLNIIDQIMDACIPQDRAPRDFCVKFPEEIRHDNLAGQLWFGAEVVAPGPRARPWRVQLFLREPRSAPERCSCGPGEGTVPRPAPLALPSACLWVSQCLWFLP